jgi:hypothetical protein
MLLDLFTNKRTMYIVGKDKKKKFALAARRV